MTMTEEGHDPKKNHGCILLRNEPPSPLPQNKMIIFTLTSKGKVNFTLVRSKSTTPIITPSRYATGCLLTYCGVYDFIKF